MRTCEHFLSYLIQFYWEWETFQTKFLDKIKTHILRSVTFFPPQNCAVYEIMWKNIVEPDRPQMTIQYSACPLCAVYLRLQTHSQYVILIAFPLQQWLNERASMFCYTYIACLGLNCSSGCDNLFACSVFRTANLVHCSITAQNKLSSATAILWQPVLSCEV